MFFKSEGKRIKIGKIGMDYVVFGKGDRALIIIPGLGDGLKTVRGTGPMLAKMYKIFGQDHRVYVFSRKNHMEEGYSTRDMARDQIRAMEKLTIGRAHVMGVSQGGMIGQYMAIDYPHMVDKLVLALSISKPSKTLEGVIKKWISLAEDKDYEKLIIDTMEKTFTENKLKKFRKAYPLITKLGRPKNFDRFIIQANSCLNHKAYDELNKIKSPTLIIGAGRDKVLGQGASEEIAEKIANSKVIIYENLGHGAYDEAKDFKQQILEFLRG